MAGLSSGDVSLLVTPQELQSKSAEVAGYVKTVRDHFDSLKMLVEESSGYWKGEASDLYRKFYKDQEADVERILLRLAEHPEDLTMIAQTYLTAEESVKQIIETLPGDVLQ